MHADSSYNTEFKSCNKNMSDFEFLWYEWKINLKQTTKKNNNKQN